MTRAGDGLDGRLLDILLPRGGTALVQFEAYLDESGCDDQSKVLVIGGYLLDVEKAKALEKKWRKALNFYKIPFFHMVDCAHGNEHFSDIPKDVRSSIAKRFIQLILDHHTWGFAYACPPRRHFPVKGMDPYAACVSMCTMALETVLRTEIPGDSFSIILEAGHKSAPLAKSALDGLLAGEHALQKLTSYAFAKKDQSVLLQAADIISWQVAKNVRNIAFDNRKSRMDFKALVQRDTTIFYVWMQPERVLWLYDVDPHIHNQLIFDSIKDLFNTGSLSVPMLKEWEKMKETMIRARGTWTWSGSTTNLFVPHRRAKKLSTK